MRTLLVLFLFAPTAVAQDLVATASLRDGGVLRAVLQEKTIEVTTKYGEIKIPIEDVRTIDFGCRPPSDIQDRVANSIRELDAADYKARAEAFRTLQSLGRWAYPALLEAKDMDMEGTRRCHQLISKIEEAFTKELLTTRRHDIVATTNMRFAGCLKNKSLRFRVAAAAPIDVPVYVIGKLEIRAVQDNVYLPAATYRYTADSPTLWLPTTLEITAGDTLTTEATGLVDIYPVEPGKHMVGPSGGEALDPSSRWPGGALIARVGKEGEIFTLGNRSVRAIPASGKLFLSVAPGPWNNGLTGGFNVAVKLSRKE